MLRLVDVVNHSYAAVRVRLKGKVLVVVLLVLVGIKVYTVEIEKTMGKFVTSKRANYKL